MAPTTGVPDISICQSDYERLSDVAEAFLEAHPEAAETLLEELDRAQIVSNSTLPANVVRMGSMLRFKTDASDGRIVTLVYPDEADIAKGKISIITPIGAALIGLSAGQSIDWLARDGVKRRLTIERVWSEGTSPAQLKEEAE